MKTLLSVIPVIIGLLVVILILSVGGWLDTHGIDPSLWP